MQYCKNQDHQKFYLKCVTVYEVALIMYISNFAHNYIALAKLMCEFNSINCMHQVRQLFQ